MSKLADVGVEIHDRLPEFINYCSATSENEWTTDVVRTRDGKNCLFGHLVDWYYGKGYDGNISPAWDMFEDIWSSTYMVYNINDGKNPSYQQPTPKQRCLAYLKNLWLGLEEPAFSWWARQ